MPPRQEMVDLCRALYDKGLIMAAEGNLSLRLDEKRILTTPSGRHKGFLKADDLVECDLEGRLTAGQGRPTSEIGMHLLCYRLRPDVRAVIHAHPPLVTAFTVAGLRLDDPVLPEVVVTLGPVPTAPFAAPTTDQGPQAIEPFIPDHNAIILDRHGSLTMGPDLLTAFARLEEIEHLARVVLTAHLLGRVKHLSPEQKAELTELGQRLGFLKR